MAAAFPEYDEFTLRIEAGHGAEYRVTGTTAPKASAREAFVLPFSAVELDELLLRLGLREKGRRDASSLAAATRFGSQLFEALFAGEIGDLYREARAAAESRDRGLRIALQLQNAPELTDIPWELLYERPAFLSQSVYSPVVRSLDLRPRRPQKFVGPLRILGVISNPTDLGNLDVERERHQIELALERPLSRGEVELNWLDGPSLASLDRAIQRSDDIHVIHYIGHGNYDEARGGGALIFQDPDGGSRHVMGEELAPLLADERSLRLVVLNSSESARTSSRSPFSSVAASLIRVGPPAAIGMQFTISDEGATAFSERLYGAIAEGYPIDAAVAEGRRALSVTGSGIEFAAPVLLLRGSETHLFELETAPPEQPETTPATETQPRLREKVEWVSDSPASDDTLGRLELARALSRRLERIRAQDRGTSFLVHVDGPWGSGKSTLLRLVGKDLQSHGWLVVSFDAWRQSRVGPPWWALLTSLRASLGAALPWYRRPGLWVAETVERLRRAGAPYSLALVVLLLLAVGLFFLFRPSQPDSTAPADVARSISAVLAAIGTLWGGAVLASKFLLWNSPAGARAYERYHDDPMENLADHFAWLIAAARRPVVFFIDDLDRCNQDYVVDLLDSVQTIVRDAPKRRGRSAEDAPYFVVAADGAWVRNSYEQAYSCFREAVSEPGRSLGYLFLNKVFQLTLRVPVLSPRQQVDYLEGLLLDDTSPPSTGAAGETRERIEASTSETEVIAALSAEPDAQVRAQLAPLAIQRLAEDEVEQTTEHALKRFAPLLEPNPRAMKRFVNDYGMTRAAGILEDNLVERDTLALWTLLAIRWPSLAEYLEEHPEAAGDVLGEPEGGKDHPDELKILIDSGLPKSVMSFPHGGPLTQDVIERCVGRHSNDDAPAEAEVS